MKPYFDAGLKAMAQSAGYPLPAIQTCGQFKRTHHFILEVWEAIYRVMVLKFEEVNSHMTCVHSQDILVLPIENFHSMFNNYLYLNSPKYKKYFENFQTFIQKMVCSDDTWRFWVQFVFQDAMAYISLFLAIRSGNWALIRVASLKSMAAVFTAFDYGTYQKLITQHLVRVSHLQAVSLKF